MAEDGAQAYELLISENPDLVLLDVGMPGMSGFEVCKKIRMLPDGDKYTIVIISAFGQISDREKAIECGANEYFSKPFSPRELLVKLESILDQVEVK
jgi:two-component system, OmpR family, alkaline phosphatase synthesis response regulator PhoP